MNNLRDAAINLRRQGWSYNVISGRLGVAKFTLSHWLRLIPYEPNAEVILRIRRNNACAGARKHQIRMERIRAMRRLAAEEIGQISEQDLMFLGWGLYIGEGTKLYKSVRLINADPRVIRVAMHWFRRVCGVPNRHFSVTIHAYPDTPMERATAFGSRVTGLPSASFEKPQIDRREGKSVRKQRRLPYGTLPIRIRAAGDPQLGVALHRRIIGWIEAAYSGLRV